MSFTQVAGEFSVYNMTTTPTIRSQTHDIPRSWICLDSGTTQCVFCNKDFMNGLTTDTTSILHTHCNAGKSTTQRYGTGFCVLGSGINQILTRRDCQSLVLVGIAKSLRYKTRISRVRSIQFWSRPCFQRSGLWPFCDGSFVYYLPHHSVS